MRFYILDASGEPVPTDDHKVWAVWFDKSMPQRVVAQTAIADVVVSTVFLAIDHAFGDGEPILYESLIFGGDHDGDMWRYHTRAEAESGHARIVAAIEAGEPA